MNSENLKIQFFSFICRTCSSPNEVNLTSIFRSKAAEMLNFCDFCTVSENDELPDQICASCLHLLKQCYTFKKLCTKSEITLRHVLEESKVGNTDPEESSTQENSVDSSDLRDEEMKLETGFSADFVKNESAQLERNDPTLNEDFISFLDKPLPPPLSHQCQHCDQSFSEEYDLNLHQSVHNSDLVCLACSKKFTGRQTLKRHLKIHLIDKPHICKICNKRFPESYALVKHLRHHSGIPREKKHLCEECGQGFSEPYYLKVHSRKHSGERPLVCTECQKSFADPRSYKTHVMIHSGERPFKCDFCPKSFVQNANLTKHLRVHTGEKPYICKICDRSFTQSSSLEKHLNVHGCRKRFEEEASLPPHESTS